MKYVFHGIFYAASAPKSAAEVIAFMKDAVGSEMLTSYFPKFLKIIHSMVDKANATKRVSIVVDIYSGIQYDDGRRHGVISLYTKGTMGQKDIARLFYIEVDTMWAEDARDGKLKHFTFNQWDKMKFQAEKEETVDEAEGLLKQMVNELREGRNVEEVVDKYVKCANSELREKLISGIKNITQKGGIL